MAGLADDGPLKDPIEGTEAVAEELEEEEEEEVIGLGAGFVTDIYTVRQGLRKD